MKIENIKVGQLVKYNQGRALGYPAKVTKIDAKKGRIHLESKRDGRKFTRSSELLTASK